MGPAWSAADATTQPLPPAAFVNDDALIVTVLQAEDRRLALMPAVAAAKWQTHAPIFDPPRESAVIQRAEDLGARMGLAANSVGPLFALQARLAREVQSVLQQKWQRAGFSYPETVPSLAQLRPRLDELTVALLQALYLAAPVLERGDFAARYAGLARQQMHEGDWTEESRSELLAALGAIRRTPAPALQRVTASAILRVGTTGDYAPFSLETNGTLAGADIELAQELARALGARAVFVRTSWASLLEDLRQDRFDLGVGGVSVTPQRQAQAAFSASYASGGKTILSRCADARKYSSLAAVDQPQVRVIVNPGGTNEAYVRANLHKARILVYPDNRAIFDTIAAGRADVMITDDVEAELQSRRHRGLCRADPGTLTHAQKALLLPRDPAFIAAVNQWLTAALAAGEPARLLQSYLNR